MTLTENEYVLSQIDGHVGCITINRPEKRNAMTLSMWQCLGDILQAWKENTAIRALIVGGAGDKSFCAGNDIKEYATIRATPEQRAAYDAVTTRAYNLLRDFPAPTVARIRGFCIGGGMELALLCDLQIADTDAVFGVTPARLGIGYKLDDVELLLQHIAPKHAREVLFTGDQYSAEDAERWGLISRAVAPQDLDSAVDTLAKRIAANAPLTVRALKATIREAASGGPDRSLCAALVEACDASADRKEGQTAFAEKRQPKFEGA